MVDRICWRLDLALSQNQLDRIEPALEEREIQYSIAPSSDPSAKVRHLLQCYLATESEAIELTEALQSLDLTESLSIHRYEVHGEEWQERWLEHFKPLAIGNRLYVLPAWDNSAVPAGRVAIKIHPHSTFGAGTHPTTQLVLELLELELEKRICAGGEVRVFDLGCGSGIVAIAARALGAHGALGVDIDTESVIVAQENCALNELSNIYFSNDNINDTAVSDRFGSFEIIVANMITSEQRGVWGAIRQVGGPDSAIILSGILVEEELDFVATLGCRVLTRREREGWVGIVCSL